MSPCDKTNKMACAPSEDSDQPGHPPSLIRVFAVGMKRTWVLSYLLSFQHLPRDLANVNEWKIMFDPYSNLMNFSILINWTSPFPI